MRGNHLRVGDDRHVQLSYRLHQVASAVCVEPRQGVQIRHLLGKVYAGRKHGAVDELAATRVAIDHGNSVADAVIPAGTATVANQQQVPSRDADVINYLLDCLQLWK